MKTFLVPLLSLLLTLPALAATGLKISELPSTNNLANNQLLVVTAGNTNMSVTYQKLAALVSVAPSNWTYTAAAACSNLAYAVGANGTNFTYSIGANATTFSYAIGANGTTFSYSIGANGTNFTYSIGANATNFVNGKTNAAIAYASDVGVDGNLTVNGTASFATLNAGTLVVTSGVPSLIVTNTGATDKQIPMFSIGGGVPGGLTNSTITTNSLVLAPSATALSNNLAGALSAASLKLTNNIEFTTTLIDGGANITNYTLIATTNDVVIGQSNVNIVAVMGGTLGNPRSISILVTNGTGFNWYISFSAVTNRWKWPISQGTPSVLTNNTQLLINARVDGTNILGAWAYYSWP